MKRVDSFFIIFMSFFSLKIESAKATNDVSKTSSRREMPSVWLSELISEPDGGSRLP